MIDLATRSPPACRRSSTDRPAVVGAASSARARSTASPRRRRAPAASRRPPATTSSTTTCTCSCANRGVLITPFHNMALMCPDTTGRRRRPAHRSVPRGGVGPRVGDVYSVSVPGGDVDQDHERTEERRDRPGEGDGERVHAESFGNPRPDLRGGQGGAGVPRAEQVPGQLHRRGCQHGAEHQQDAGQQHVTDAPPQERDAAGQARHGGDHDGTGRRPRTACSGPPPAHHPAVPHLGVGGRVHQQPPEHPAEHPEHEHPAEHDHEVAQHAPGISGARDPRPR